MLIRCQSTAVALILVTLSLQACAGRGDAARRSAPADRNVISLDELMSAEPRATALQMVERIRPRWLSGRGPIRPSSPQPAVVVYVNSQKHGGVEALQRFTVGDVEEIRFLDAMSATRVFGTGHMAGAILITTRGAVR